MMKISPQRTFLAAVLGSSTVLCLGSSIVKDFYYATYERDQVYSTGLRMVSSKGKNPEKELSIAMEVLYRFSEKEIYPFGATSKLEYAVEKARKEITPADSEKKLTDLGNQFIELASRYQGNPYLELLGLASLFCFGVTLLRKPNLQSHQ